MKTNKKKHWMRLLFCFPFIHSSFLATCRFLSSQNAHILARALAFSSATQQQHQHGSLYLRWWQRELSIETCNVIIQSNVTQWRWRFFRPLARFCSALQIGNAFLDCNENSVVSGGLISCFLVFAHEKANSPMTSVQTMLMGTVRCRRRRSWCFWVPNKMKTYNKTLATGKLGPRNFARSRLFCIQILSIQTKTSAFSKKKNVLFQLDNCYTLDISVFTVTKRNKNSTSAKERQRAKETERERERNLRPSTREAFT